MVYSPAMNNQPRLVDYARVAVDRLLPRWGAIGARLYPPKLSTARLGPNVLEQDSIGRTVAGSVQSLLEAQRRSSDILLHLQDNGPEHLIAECTYSLDNICYLYTSRGICRNYTPPPIDEPNPYVIGLIYSSASEVFLGRTTVTESNSYATLKNPDTNYKRWVWIETAQYEAVSPETAWLHSPYFKVNAVFPGGLSLCASPILVLAKEGSNSWMRGVKDWAVKTGEILFPGTILRTMTNHPVSSNHLYRCFLQIWCSGEFAGRVRVYASQHWDMDDKMHPFEPGKILAFDVETELSLHVQASISPQ